MRIVQLGREGDIWCEILSIHWENSLVGTKKRLVAISRTKMFSSSNQILAQQKFYLTNQTNFAEAITKIWLEQDKIFVDWTTILLSEPNIFLSVYLHMYCASRKKFFWFKQNFFNITNFFIVSKLYHLPKLFWYMEYLVDSSKSFVWIKTYFLESAIFLFQPNEKPTICNANIFLSEFVCLFFFKNNVLFSISYWTVWDELGSRNKIYVKKKPNFENCGGWKVLLWH